MVLFSNSSFLNREMGTVFSTHSYEGQLSILNFLHISLFTIHSIHVNWTACHMQDIQDTVPALGELSLIGEDS